MLCIAKTLFMGRVFSPTFRAVDGARTRDPQLGKLMLYQLSYYRRTDAKILLLFLMANAVLIKMNKNLLNIFSIPVSSIRPGLSAFEHLYSLQYGRVIEVGVLDMLEHTQNLVCYV